MITPQQILNPQVKPKWQLPVGVMESVVAYNCRKHGFPLPVGAWPMWEGAGNRALDYSGHGHHGVLSGCKFVPEGIIFSNSSFQRVSIPQSSDFTPPNISIVVNFYLQNEIDYSRVINNYDDNGWLIQSRSRDHVYRFFLETSSLFSFSGSDPVNDVGRWVQLVCVYDGSYIKSYRNGILDGSPTAVTGSITVPTSDLTFGQQANDSDLKESFDGIISNVEMFDSALSVAQIKFISDNPYFMYQIPEELYGYVSAVVGEANPYWYYQMLKRRN